MALSRKSKVLIAIGIFFLFTVTVVASLLAGRSDTVEVTVITTEVHEELRSTVTAPGEIRPIQYINLTSEVQGRIEEIFVKEGDVVDKGERLVRLDPNQLQSSTDAQIAALNVAQTDVQSSRSQVAAAQNQLNQAQQGLNAQEAAISTAQQQVATAQESVNKVRQEAVRSKTEVDRTNVELKAALRELKRNEELLESGVISRRDYDNAKDRVDNARVALRNAQAQVKSANISVREAQNRVKEARARVNESRARTKQQSATVNDARRAISTASIGVRSSQSRANQQSAVLRGQRNQRDKTLQVAPIAGVIAQIPSKVGTFATANLSSTPLLTIADMSTVNIEVKVDETEIKNVAVGQTAIVKVDAFGDTEIKGEVSQKTPLAVGKSSTSGGGLTNNINVSDAKEFRVVVELKDVPDELRLGLRPGMSATAVITTKVQHEVISVPIQAVIEKKPEAEPAPTIEGEVPQPEDNKGGKEKPIKGVYVLEGNKVKFLEVETGITGESDIEIISGVNADQEIVTGPSRVLNKLKENDAVKKSAKKDIGKGKES